MIIFTFDGTTNGFLTCVFESYYKKILPDQIVFPGVQYSLVDEIVEIPTDDRKAERVLLCIKKARTPFVFRDLKLSFKSGEENKFTVAFNYVKQVIDNKDIDVSTDFANRAVLDFSDCLRRTFNEVHRFKGFIRFSQTANGFFYAHYSPDNDITELLLPHFKARYKNQAFAIHDVKRNVLALYDGKQSKIIYADDAAITVYFSEEEKTFRDLWKTYYDSVNIPERKNRKQMIGHMPRKYWKDLPEKYQ
ncbi:MAG: TIGR03915 family putative DNA repair protein [Clostridia bacterium]|nr:TIGR03915 family putative DNA repair protein [Clostridia bacterium]